jgi:hypothetical protein
MPGLGRAGREVDRRAIKALGLRGAAGFMELAGAREELIRIGWTAAWLVGHGLSRIGRRTSRHRP